MIVYVCLPKQGVTNKHVVFFAQIFATEKQSSATLSYFSLIALK